MGPPAPAILAMGTSAVPVVLVCIVLCCTLTVPMHVHVGLYTARTQTAAHVCMSCMSFVCDAHTPTCRHANPTPHPTYLPTPPRTLHTCPPHPAPYMHAHPTPHHPHPTGDKTMAKSMMEKAGVPVVPGYHGESQQLDVLLHAAQKVGYPLLVKAAMGGGGKGMKLATGDHDVQVCGVDVGVGVCTCIPTHASIRPNDCM